MLVRGAASSVMRVAIEGCSHGCLDQIYASIAALDRQDGKKTDLLLLCGDVQTLRNTADLDCLAVPDKYKQMGDFHRYYSHERKAPILTLMIGGNHEASNYLWELFYGGWVAPNIYYLGAAGCVDVGGLTISGISGIFKSHDFTLGRFERMPYDRSSVRSAYHTRCFDTFRLLVLARVQARLGLRTTIALSHDWPNTIEQHGDVDWLTWKKPFFKQEIQTATLGSPPLMDVLRALRPAFWFSAHLHTRFAALVKHDGAATKVKKKTEEQAPATTTTTTTDAGQQTKFLALSKCLPGQDFLQIIDVPSDGHPPTLSFNPVWLAVLRATQPFLSLERQQTPLADVDDEKLLSEVESEAVKRKNDSLDVSAVQSFVQTAPASDKGSFPGPPPWFTNPQTVSLCSFLGIPNQINPPPPLDEADEIRRIEETARRAMERQDGGSTAGNHDEEINVTLSDEDEEQARWKEGTG